MADLIPDWMLTTSVRDLVERDDMEGTCRLSRLQSSRRDIAQCWDLIRAGWRIELPGGPDADPDPMSFYWRRPPRRKGSGGRLYMSTNQAHNALMRED